MKRRLCIAIHDVSPATWPQCERLLRMLAMLGHNPVTLAVVPDWHGESRIDRAPQFRERIDACLADGAEVALHGYRHLDDGTGRASWLARHVLTAGEGEFAALVAPEATARLERGCAMLAKCGWYAAGFIPPAWLTSDGALEALAHSSFTYTSSQLALMRLADRTTVDAPCITVSARSAWRRGASKLWLRAAERATASAPLVRVALHPVDAAHEDIARCWRELIARLLASRTAVTKSQAVAACA